MQLGTAHAVTAACTYLYGRAHVFLTCDGDAEAGGDWCLFQDSLDESTNLDIAIASCHHPTNSLENKTHAMLSHAHLLLLN